MASSEYLIIGNWKMNPVTKGEAKQLFQAIKKQVPRTLPSSVRVVVAPPSLFLSECSGVRPAQLSLGAQNAAATDSGPYTGEVSVAQLASYNVSHVIIGHSERRALGESDEEVLVKVQLVLKRKLTPVVCIGELLRDSDGQFFSVVESQLKSLSQALSATEMKKVVIAYEPIWAIGTGKTATVEDVKEMQLFIHSILTKAYDRSTAGKVQLIYGGSVKASNAAELHVAGGMRGFLVGGASLVPSEFGAIIKSLTK